MTRLHDDSGHNAPALWQLLGRWLAPTAIAILLSVAIVYGEAWAIRQTPLLPSDRSTNLSPEARCVSDDSPDAGELSLAVLH